MHPPYLTFQGRYFQGEAIPAMTCLCVLEDLQQVPYIVIKKQLSQFSSHSSGVTQVNRGSWNCTSPCILDQLQLSDSLLRIAQIGCIATIQTGGDWSMSDVSKASQLSALPAGDASSGTKLHIISIWGSYLIHSPHASLAHSDGPVMSPDMPSSPQAWIKQKQHQKLLTSAIWVNLKGHPAAPTVWGFFQQTCRQLL